MKNRPENYYRRVGRFISVILIYAFGFISPVQGRPILEKTYLSPALHSNDAGFQGGYGQFYKVNGFYPDTTVPSDDVQKVRQQELIRKITGVLKDSTRFTERDAEKVAAIIELVRAAYGEKKFLPYSQEFVFNHVLEVTYETLQEQCSDLTTVVCAALLHRLSASDTRLLLKKKLRPKEIEDILSLLDRFAAATELIDRYADMRLNGTRDIQNVMNMLIQQTGDNPAVGTGDPRAMLLVMADKLASIRFSSESERKDLIPMIECLVAPLAHRLGAESIKDRLFDAIFRFNNPQEYAQTKYLVKQYTGIDYDAVDAEFDNIRRGVVEYLNVHFPGIPVEVKMRKKGVYEIYEKLQSVGTGYKLHDLVGIRLVCDCDFSFLAQFSTAILENIGSWQEKEYRRYFDKNSGKYADGIYIDMGKENTIFSAPCEVQILTRSFHEQRERENPHWAYKLARRTGQKFDEIEDYVPIGNFEKDFQRVYSSDALKNWVFIFSFIRDRDGHEFFRPKRLARGAIPGDVAALRSVNLLDRFFSAKVMRWIQGELEETRLGGVMDYELKSGDVVQIVHGTRELSLAAIDTLRSKSKALRTRLQVSLIDLGEDAAGDDQRILPGEKSVREQFRQAGIDFNDNDENSPGLRFLSSFAEQNGLADIRELFMAITYWSSMVNISAIMEAAKENGKVILKEKARDNKISLDDFLLGQLAHEFGVDSRERFFIQIGAGQIEADELGLRIQRLKQGSRASSDIADIRVEQLHRFTLTLSWEGLKKAGSAKIKKMRQDIESMVEDNGMDLVEKIKTEEIPATGRDGVMQFVVKSSDSVKINAFVKAMEQVLQKRKGTLQKQEYYNARERMQGWALVFRMPDRGMTADVNQSLWTWVKTLSAKSSLSRFEAGPAEDGSGGIIVNCVIVTDVDTKTMRENLLGFFRADRIVSSLGSPRVNAAPAISEPVEQLVGSAI